MTEQFILTSNDQQTQLNVRHWPCPSPIIAIFIKDK